MQKTLQAVGYVPGTAVFLSVLVPGDQQKGCKGRYEVEVFQQGRGRREIKGMNYDPGSPANDTFAVLSSSEAGPGGALFRVTVFLQKMNHSKFNFDIKGQQGKKILFADSPSNTFTSGQVAVYEYDIFCT